MTSSQAPNHPVRSRNVPVLITAIGMLLAGTAWLALRGDPSSPLLAPFGLGQRQGLQPALFQIAPLRTAQGGVDRAYLLSSQSQTVYLVARRGGMDVRTDYLHIDLWAVDAATATVAWRRRLRTFEGIERVGRNLPAFRILGADGTTLWLDVEGPLGVSLADGRTVADGASIEGRNPQLAGKLVTAPGYVAFGRNGLQLTLDDASQWRIDAADLMAATRDTPVTRPGGIVPPANPRPSSTSHFQLRALSAGDRWLGVLTDAEANDLSHAPVVPGRDPNERPGVMQQFLSENHVPRPLNEPLPQPYRLWSARTKEVSAAPPDWPKELPDRWGTRTEFSDYSMLPDSPAFLRAGLLRPHPDTDVPLWYRNPDSVLVLHANKLGPAGRLMLTRISGPLGKRVWSASLPLASLQSVMRGEHDLLLWGSEPGVDTGQDSGESSAHASLVSIDVRSGLAVTLDLTAEGFTRPPSELEALP